MVAASAQNKRKFRSTWKAKNVVNVASQEEIVYSTATPLPLMRRQLLIQAWKPQAIYVAAYLRLAEALAERPRTVAQLAR